MKTYLCWAPEHEEEDAARKYQADNWKDAAEAYARWSFNEEEFDEIEVHVRCERGELFAIDVEAEMELSFHLAMGRKLEDKREANASPEVQS